MSTTLKDISFTRMDGQKTSISDYEGNVLLIVNVASACGLTPQYEGLEKLYEKYHAQGLEVLGFPANEFGAQEPGSNADIQAFCSSKFGVKFSMFEKIVVKGPGIHPLYDKLIHSGVKVVLPEGSDLEAKLEEHGLLTGEEEEITWNFEKFLVNRQGQVIARFAPDMKPEDDVIVSAIEKALKS
ncbi:MAG: redoxin domain-containing protein [Proteobacteria bacterium]|nr:MAG: redoxin domain-containing protein [Pseudomonadota bacterium]